MNETEKKREAVLGAYPGAAWREKVKAMSEKQVIAVYFRLRNKNKI